MKDFVTSLVRTYVPIVVGAVAGYFASKGFDLDAQAQAGLIVGLSGLLMGGYYLLARLVEQRFPSFGGLLLGAPRKAPQYVRNTTPVKVASRKCDC